MTLLDWLKCFASFAVGCVLLVGVMPYYLRLALKAGIDGEPPATEPTSSDAEREWEAG